MSEFYTVKKGDTLWGIAKHYNIHVSDLASINHLQGDAVHHLRLGQKIYLKEHPKDVKTYETKLIIKLFDLAFKPIKKATLRIEHDDKKETIEVHDGITNDIFIEDHAKGLKVYFKNLKGEFDLIADHKKVSIGNKVLKITSRKVLVEGSYHPKEGVQHTSVDLIKRYIRRAGRELADHTQKVLTQASAPQTAPVQTEAKTQPPKATTPAPKTPPPPKPPLEAPKVETPPPVNEQKRTDQGNSTHVVAVHFSEANFIIIPENEKYRGYIFAAAKRHNLTPHSLAALINAEAAKIPKTRGEWNPNSRAPSPGTAAGLTQFLNASWLEIALNDNALVGQYVAQAYPKLCENNKKGLRALNPPKPKKGEPPVVLTAEQKVLKEAILELRFNPEMSIDAAGAYARANLKGLKNSSKIQTPEALAKLAYFLHHEGLAGANTIINNKLTEARAQELLRTQVAKAKDKWLKRYDNDPIKAYKAWLMGYVNDHIKIENFYDKGKNNKTTYNSLDFEEVLVQLNPEYQRIGTPAPLEKAKTTEQSKPQQAQTKPAEQPKPQTKPVEQPKPQATSTEQNKPQTQPQQTVDTASGVVGGENGWFDPVKKCKLRTVGLSAKGATFGMVRNGGTKPHQGIDLEAEPGTNIFAVCGGTIAIARKDESPKGYGWQILLKVNVADLPPKHQAYARTLVGNQQFIYFFYAHLSKMDVGTKDTVQAGQKIGQTGCTGNAFNMTSIATGAHLHFEVRDSGEYKPKLEGRFNPLSFISNKLL